MSRHNRKSYFEGDTNLEEHNFKNDKTTDRAQIRCHFALKLSYAKLMLCYANIV
jgi:hypothetical protein